MDGAPRGRPGPSEPIASPARDAAPEKVPPGPAVPEREGREGWPWQFQLNARRPSSPMAQLRALSGGRTNVVNATARASYESALMSAIRRQMDAFEEKWEKKLRGDDHYWLTRPAHGAQGAHGVQGGDGRLRQERRDFSATTLDRLFDRVNVLESQQPRVEKRLAELDGKVKGLSDELQGQIRQVHLLDDRRWEWKQKIEEELAAKCQALQQQMQALVASSRSISLEEDSRQQRTWHSALEEGLSAAAMERNAMHQEVHEGFVNVCERLAALEMQLEDRPPAESLALKGDAKDDFATEVLSKRLEDLERSFEEARQDNFEIHQRHAAQEEQIRTLRTRFENREEQLRDLGERVERSDWDVKLSQIRQAIQEHQQQRTLQSEKLELLSRRVEYQEQVVEDVRFASRPALEPPLGVMEPVAVEDLAAPALTVLEDQMKVMAAEIKRLQEPQEDKLGLSSLVSQLKEISPKVIAHEKCIRRLEDGAKSQAEAKAEEVSQASSSLVSLKEQLERLEQAQNNTDSEQKLMKLRQDLTGELQDLRHRGEENLKELSSELSLRLAKLETSQVELEKLESRWEKRLQQLQQDDAVKGDMEKRLDRIEARSAKAEEEKWLKFQQELQEHKQQMESRLELLQVPSFEDQDFGKDLLLKREGTWTLNGSHGPYAFEPRNGWLSVKDQRIGRFSCKRIQDKPLHWPTGEDFSNLKNLSIVSSEIMTELQRQENDGALFVLPSQLNGAEYPSHLHEDIVYDVEDYKYDNTGGPRGQLALHPAAAQFLLDNARNAQRTGGLSAAAALDIKEFEAINGYLKIQDTSDTAAASSLQTLREKLHTLRPLIFDELLAQGVTPDKRSLFEGRHRVGVVYASPVPVNAYLNQVDDGSERSVEFQTQVAELFLVAQYYAALKYAAESVRDGRPGRRRNRTVRRRVYLMPLGGGVFNTPWEIIARSMAKALQMLDDESLEMLDICALAWKGDPSEEQRLREVFCQLNSAYGSSVPVTVTSLASSQVPPTVEVLKAQEELRAEVLSLKELRHQLEVAAVKDEATKLQSSETQQEVQRKFKTLEAELAETKVQLTAWRNSTEEASIEKIEATSALSVATRDAVGQLEKDLANLKERFEGVANGNEPVFAMECPYCGDVYAQDSKFCQKCGKPRTRLDPHKEGLQYLQTQVTCLSERLNAFVAAQIQGHDLPSQSELALLADALQKDEREEQEAHTRLLLRIDELCTHLSKAAETPAPWVQLEALGRQVEEMQKAERQMEAKLESFVATASLE